MTKVEIQAIFNELDKVLGDFGRKYNMTIVCKNRKYDRSGLYGNLVMLCGSEDKSGEQIDFENKCRIYGLKPEDYNREILVGGKSCKIVGINTKAKSYPIIVRDNSGTQYKVGIGIVKREIGVVDYA